MTAQSNGTILLDVDSTVLRKESFEELVRLVTNDRKILDRIAELSRLAMEGKITFQESISERLKISGFRPSHVSDLRQTIRQWITPGFPELIREWQNDGISVWLISGALHEIVQETAHCLGIPSEQAYGIKLIWQGENADPKIDPSDLLARSKLEGAKALASRFQNPTVMVGDGMTDYEIFEHGVSHHFIAYTQWVKRKPVIDKAMQAGQSEAASARDLQSIISLL